MKTGRTGNPRGPSGCGRLRGATCIPPRLPGETVVPAPQILCWRSTDNMCVGEPEFTSGLLDFYTILT